MSHIGKNIKKIRTVKKLSQTQFGELFGMSRGTIGAYEEERAEPKIDGVIQIAKHFGLSVDVLLIKELTVNELFSFNILNKKFNDAHHFDETSSRRTKKEGIKLVQLERRLEYLVNLDNRDYLSKLPTIDLPVGVPAQSRAFVLEGSEMEYNQNGLHHGDILLSKACEVSLDLVVDKVYVVVTGSEMYTRRLQKLSMDTLELKSDDPNYDLLSVSRVEIKEIWEVVGVYSTYLNPPKMLEERVMLIESQLIALQDKTAKL